MDKLVVLCLLISIFYNNVRADDEGNTTTNNEFATYIEGCHYKDPNVTKCIQKAAEHAKFFLARGVPSLGIQSLEPLKVPSVRLRQHKAPRNGFKYDAWLSDVTLHGLTDFSFNKLDQRRRDNIWDRRRPNVPLEAQNNSVLQYWKSLTAHDIAIQPPFNKKMEVTQCGAVYPEQLKVTANISLPHLYMLGEYVVLGHFQMLPVESTGKITANFTSCTGGIEALGARVHKRMVVKDAMVRLSCTGPVLADLNDSHSATNEMEMITDHIASMHAKDIIREVQPAVETALSMVLEDIANKFLKHIPYDMVFPN